MTPKETDHRIFIALGSSIGDAEAIFLSAQKWLEQKDIQVLKKSKNYRFPPFGGIAQNEFTNAVWQISFSPRRVVSDQSEEAQDLLDLLLECEKAHGRTREIKWGDRTLDLDLLIYKDLVCKTRSLTLPHPSMDSRDFVQIPLKEIYLDYSPVSDQDINT